MINARHELEAAGVQPATRWGHDSAVGRFAGGVAGLPGQANPEPKWEEAVARFRAADARCTLWTSEALSLANAERVAFLGDKLGTDAHVAVTLRPLVDLLASQWQQGLRKQRVEPLGDWLTQNFADYDNGTSDNARDLSRIARFSMRRILEDWGSVFGHDRLIFVIPERGNRDSILRTFEGLLGVPQLLEQPSGNNPSLPYAEAEMLRHFNREVRDRGGDDRARIRVLRQHAKQGLWKASQASTSDRIRPPRWVAERSNELTADWIRAVEGSEATVVGSLDQLLVDPQDYPVDPATPSHISVETAGTILDVVFEGALKEEPSPPKRRKPRTRRRSDGLEAYSRKELVAELRRRVTRRLGR